MTLTHYCYYRDRLGFYYHFAEWQAFVMDDFGNAFPVGRYLLNYDVADWIS